MKNPEIRLDRAGRMGKRTKAKAKKKERRGKNKIMQVSLSAHSALRITFPAGDTHAWPCSFENVAPESSVTSLSCCSPPCLPSSVWLIPPASRTLYSQTQQPLFTLTSLCWLLERTLPNSRHFFIQPQQHCLGDMSKFYQVDSLER